MNRDKMFFNMFLDVGKEAAHSPTKVSLPRRLNFLVRSFLPPSSWQPIRARPVRIEGHGLRLELCNRISANVFVITSRLWRVFSLLHKTYGSLFIVKTWFVCIFLLKILLQAASEDLNNLVETLEKALDCNTPHFVRKVTFSMEVVSDRPYARTQPYGRMVPSCAKWEWGPFSLARTELASLQWSRMMQDLVFLLFKLV